MRATTTNVVRKYPFDGKPEDADEKMTLAQMQAYVGGYIEHVPTSIAHRVLIVNDECFIQMLPANFAATEVVRKGVWMVDGLIRGNALLVKG